jgi:hypothetical protein
MFFRPKTPVTAATETDRQLDPREADLARLKSADQAATDALQQAQVAKRVLIEGPKRLVLPEEVAVINQTLRSAMETKEQTAAELATHLATFDLDAMTKTLAAERKNLKMEQLLERTKARLKRKLLRGLEIEADELEDEQDARQSPEAARMIVSFPAGVFAPVEVAGQGTYRRSVFNDELLRGIAILHPDLLDLLPPERKAEVLSRIDPAHASTRYFARVDWSIQDDRELTWNNDLRARVGEQKLLQDRNVRRFHPRY